jgi:hypothetical protein
MIKGYAQGDQVGNSKMEVSNESNKNRLREKKKQQQHLRNL